MAGNTSIAEALQPLAARMSQVVREREILRVAATIGGSNADRAVEEARNEILRWAENRAGGRLPEAAWKHEEFEHFAGGRDCTAVRIVDENRDIWAIRSDDPDKSVAQRVWTIEAVVGRKLGQRPLFSLRLLVNSPEQQLYIEPAVPGLVQQVSNKCRLYLGGDEVDVEPRMVASEDDAAQLIDLLLDPTRRIPVFVLTVPDYAIDPDTPLVDPLVVARTTVGLASTIVLRAPLTWALTECFGKRLSVYGGAVRVYLPGFTEDANPYGGHDLFLPDRLYTGEGVAEIAARLRQAAATESLRRLRLGKDVLSFSAVRQLSLDRRRSRLEREGASETEQLSAVRAQVAALEEQLQSAQELQQWLFDEQAATEERAKSAEAQLTAAGYRVQQLLDQLQARGESPDTNIALPSSWPDFADWCDQNLVGRVLLAPRARREVKAPLFRDVAGAARCLLWLANEYRERKLHGGNGEPSNQLEGGIRNERAGADSFEFEWQGVRREVEWHIKNGGNTRDPTRCLRIYYFWDETSQQVVIASMPAHIRTDAT